MRALTILVALLMTPALLAIAHASPCDSDGQPAVGIVELPALAGHIFYVDDRNAVTGNQLFLYEETNGVYLDDPGQHVAPAHLQRGSFIDFWPPPLPFTSSVDPCVDPRPEGTEPDVNQLIL